MGPGSLLAGSQAEAQTYLSPAGRQRPQPQAPGAQKSMCLLGLQELVSKQDRTAWPQGSPQSQGKAGPKGAGLDQLGPRGRKGPESEMQACAAGSPSMCAGGRQQSVRQTASWAARTRRPDPISPSINTVSWVLQCPQSLRIWLLCWHYLNPTTSFSEPQHPTVHQVRGPWSQAQELVLGQSGM